MPALQKFLQAELHRRDWSIETFARRVPMSVSRGYQIVSAGQDNVRQDMFDQIAAALDMTPADLAAQIGAGLTQPERDEMERIAIVRQVSDEDWPAVKKMLLGLTLQPVEPTRTSNGPRDGAANRRSGGRRHLDPHTRSADDHGLEGGLPTVYPRFGSLLASIAGSFKRWLEPTNARLTAQPAQ